MSIPIEILLLTSGVGALQSVFFGLYLFSQKKGRHLTNLLLASLLLAFAIRMTKSIVYYFAEGHAVPVLLQNFGYGANLAILPLLWLYLKAFLNTDYQFRWIKDFAHLLPCVLVIILSPFLTPHFWMDQHGYTLSLVLMGIYVPFCFYLIQKHFSSISRAQQVWVLCLALGITVVWASYTANYIFGLVPYITAPVIFSFVIYFMSYLGLQQGNMFIREARYLNSAFPAPEIAACFEKLQCLMKDLQPYRDPSLTLPKIARQLGVSPHLLSASINKKAGQNFSDFINSYRIKDAQLLLASPEYHNQKIAAIAFETGFHSLSSFNTSFKKVTLMTPSEYRKQASRT
jgi:AraC-like DNA-binding protein